MAQKVLDIDLENMPMAKSSTNKNKKNQSWPPKWLMSRRGMVGAIGALLILLAGGLFWYVQSQPTSPISKYIPLIPSPTPEVPNVPNPLNGVLYTKAESEQHANKRPMAVMIENHTEARPQAGLADAEIIHEAMAEGGITRFMGVYLHNSPEKITPIRSARLHFVDWAAEYDAIYAHWGGSAEALDFLRNSSRPKDLDQFRFGNAFYRDYSAGRSLEHTGATSMESLRQAAQGQGWESTPSFDSWDFKDEVEAEARPESQVINLGLLGTFGYAVQFDYQPETNSYLRSTGGQAHMDANGQQLAPKTIILLIQSATNYTDAGGHPAVRVVTTGTGEAVIFQDGVATTGTWHKDNRNSRTILTDADGDPIQLNRGQIWVISVPNGSAISY